VIPMSHAMLLFELSYVLSIENSQSSEEVSY